MIFVGTYSCPGILPRACCRVYLNRRCGCVCVCVRASERACVRACVWQYDKQRKEWSVFRFFWTYKDGLCINFVLHLNLYVRIILYNLWTFLPPRPIERVLHSEVWFAVYTARYFLPLIWNAQFLKKHTYFWFTFVIWHFSHLHRQSYTTLTLPAATASIRRQPCDRWRVCCRTCIRGYTRRHT